MSPHDTDADVSLVPQLEASIAIVKQRDELARLLGECADRFERCCIHSGSDKDFAAAVESKHGASQIGDEYRLLIQFIRLRFNDSSLQEADRG